MDGTLRFKLPEDQREFEAAVKASDLSCVIWDIDQKLRGLVKHSPDDADPKKLDAYDEVRTWLREIVEEHGVGFVWNG